MGFLSEGSKSIPQRLPRLERVLDPRLSFLRSKQLHEARTLEIEEPLLVHRRAGLDVASAQHIRDVAGDQKVVLRDLCAGPQVGEMRLQRRERSAACGRNVARL